MSVLNKIELNEYEQTGDPDRFNLQIIYRWTEAICV